MKRLEHCRLYGILDLSYVGPAEIVAVAAQMIEGGVDIMQLRAKKFIPEDVAWMAEQLHPITSEAGVPLVINDFPQVAAEIGAEGVHTGQDDLPVAVAREQAGYRTIIGRSTHSLEQAKAAAADDDTDYIGYGPLFATPTKPAYPPVGLEQIRAVHEAVSKPVFCIGGIKLENLASVIEAGAKRVVIVSGILQAKDMAQYCREVKGMLG